MTTPTTYKGISSEKLRDLIKYRSSEEEIGFLVSDVSDEEVKGVLFSIPRNKSSGPNGYTCEFYTSSWSIIDKDFTTAVKSFFTKGFLPKGINSTILSLIIPKKDHAESMSDYRPISCCNVIYKVISKILTNCLKKLLPNIISLNQYAFVKEMLLLENVLVASELVKDYHNSSISPRCAMKIDISKAFDSV